MERNKYAYLGNSYPGVPDPWKPIVMNMLRDIDKEIRPWFIPRFICNWIQWLAMRNSGVSINNYFWYNLISKIRKNTTIFDIKDKYATLRVYGSFNNKCQAIVDKAEAECDNTCEYCGSTNNVTDMAVKGWVTNLCEPCRTEIKNKKKNGNNSGSSTSN